MTAPREQAKSAATPAYLTAVQVAELLQVDAATVYRWASSDATMPATRTVAPSASTSWPSSAGSRHGLRRVGGWISHQEVGITEPGTSTAA